MKYLYQLLIWGNFKPEDSLKYNIFISQKLRVLNYVNTKISGISIKMEILSLKHNFVIFSKFAMPLGRI